mgnify:CR=1 FL=1
MCLGQEDSADFTNAARSENWRVELKNTITEAISRKPKGHDFNISKSGINISSNRHMSVTGG